MPLRLHCFLYKSPLFHYWWGASFVGQCWILFPWSLVNHYRYEAVCALFARGRIEFFHALIQHTIVFLVAFFVICDGGVEDWIHTCPGGLWKHASSMYDLGDTWWPLFLQVCNCSNTMNLWGPLENKNSSYNNTGDEPHCLLVLQTHIMFFKPL